MDAALQSQLTIAALVCSTTALFFSLLAAFPGLKVVLAAVRDGVLWLALFLVLGAIAFVVWQRVEAQTKNRPAATAVSMLRKSPVDFLSGGDEHSSSEISGTSPLA